jgi:glyoxylase-like metal-dependent hydrolase (beta-lactamase superfamily II)
LTNLFSARDIGNYKVTALSDGVMKASLSLLSGIAPEAAVNIQQHAGIKAADDIQINSYLIRGAGRIILIDSGMGNLNHIGGELRRNLLLSGIMPDEVDTVLLTHAHPDHIGGLLGENGRPAYRNAALYISKAEANFWLDNEKLTSLSERALMNGSLFRRTFEAYSTVRFTEETAIAKDITAVSLPGHTPGHSGYLIDSRDEKLLIWGDITHYPHIQIAHPQVSIAFDYDPDQAEQTRRAILERASRENLLIAGMHLGVSGFAYIRSHSEGHYFLEYV